VASLGFFQCPLKGSLSPILGIGRFNVKEKRISTQKPVDNRYQSRVIE
jgi:hypothetical protein